MGYPHEILWKKMFCAKKVTKLPDLTVLILEYNVLLKLYWEAQETIPTTYPRIQYAIEAALESTVGDAYYLS